MPKTKPTLNKAAQIASLNRRVVELLGQLSSTYTSAYRALDKTGVDHLTASGVMVTLTALGGRQLAEPFCLRGGLSEATIAALKADIKRSYEQSIHKLD